MHCSRWTPARVEGFSNYPYLCGSLASETETNRDRVTSIPGLTIEKVNLIYMSIFHNALLTPTAVKTDSIDLGFEIGMLNIQNIYNFSIALPVCEAFWGSNLTTAANNNSMPISREMIWLQGEIEMQWAHLKHLLKQQSRILQCDIGMVRMELAPHLATASRVIFSNLILFESAVQAHVLMKNVDSALPLRSSKLFSLFGYDAKAPDHNNSGPGYSSGTYGFEVTDIDEALPSFLDYQPDTPTSQITINGTLISEGGSGSNNRCPSRISSPFDAIRQRAFDDGGSIFWDFIIVGAIENVDPASKAYLVFINSFASESIDRVGFHDDYPDALVNNISNLCNNTTVIIHNAGVRLVNQFINQDNVTAVIFAHLPGQESAAFILHGDTAPSGKLPYSIPMNEPDYGLLFSLSIPQPSFEYFPQSNSTEGIYIDYRAFDSQNITPRFKFDYGLLYTTFSHSNLSVKKTVQSPLPEFPFGAVKEGGMEDLWDIILQLSVQVENSGMMDGAEFAQLYIGVPGGPVRQLRDFDKIEITPREKVTVGFELTRRDLSTWDTKSQMWVLQKGTYNTYAAGSRELPLLGVINL
ncbi:hypothetical protein BTUL_0306g00100 [Botrytis tulipae]|uniref:beta-glucosidase n=1 Tax=Botrytis tulipae TaxID=87230 RepID=A0A4Z1ECX9_9HELO|nr:hypothetical protein BTUL_0306g00100 [Botrytis tulipae]